ncbi:hypothetical protein VNO77_03938 [Canavalia gladiata]|uniref:Uncharacterized protein n=1 Tax=Canavalia gladiata TaxID=3824 RepID=A0AAN9N233_CANGL
MPPMRLSVPRYAGLRGRLDSGDNNYRRPPEISAGRARWCSELLDIKGIQFGMVVIYVHGYYVSIHRSSARMDNEHECWSLCII